MKKQSHHTLFKVVNLFLVRLASVEALSFIPWQLPLKKPYIFIDKTLIWEVDSRYETIRKT